MEAGRGDTFNRYNKEDYMRQISTVSQYKFQSASYQVEMTNLILSPCGFAALALSSSMNEKQKKVVTNLEHLTEDDILLMTRDLQHMRVIVYLPLEPIPFLQTLRVLFLFLRNCPAPLDILVITGCSSRWLYKTLLGVLREPFFLSLVTIVDIDMPQDFIVDVLSRHTDVPTLAFKARQELPGMLRNPKGITESELNVILDYLSGKSIEEQHSLSGISHSRLYALRRTGMQKLCLLGSSFSTLAKGGKSGATDNRHASARSLHLSDSVAFSSAMRDGLIVPAFKQYVDAERKLTGFELQARWYQRDNRLQGSDFLTKDTPRELLTELTAWKLAVAVDRINRSNGNMWFSLKVPNGIVDSRLLPRLVENALRGLLVREWAQCLALEISAPSGLEDLERSEAVLLTLKSFGCKLILSYSMHRNGLTFPFKKHIFDSLKLDVLLLSDFLADSEMRNVVRALVFFCSLSGCRCIVSGIDNQPDYDELNSMGVDDFQGPVTSEFGLDKGLKELSINCGLPA